MDPTNCAQVYGPAVGQFCRRAVEVGWDATATAGWLSGLAGVMAGFHFAALVLVLGVRFEESTGGHIGDAALADAFPGWMVVAVLSGTGVLFALHHLNMPPVALDDRPEGSRLRIWRDTPQPGVTTGATPGA